MKIVGSGTEQILGSGKKTSFKLDGIKRALKERILNLIGLTIV